MFAIIFIGIVTFFKEFIYHLIGAVLLFSSASHFFYTSMYFKGDFYEPFKSVAVSYNYESHIVYK